MATHKTNDRAQDKLAASLPGRGAASRGSQLALANAKRHLRAAELLGQAKLRGPGLSHLILALEELAKGYILAIVALGFDLPEKMLATILRDHGPRHAVIWGVIISSMMAFVGDRAARRVQRRHRVKGHPTALRDEWVQEFVRESQRLTKKSPRTDPLLRALEWMKNPSDRKNRGFYVDYSDGKWRHPGTVTISQFAVELEITRALVRRVGGVQRAFLRSGFRPDAATQEWFRKSLEPLPGAKPEDLATRLLQVTFSGMSGN